MADGGPLSGLGRDEWGSYLAEPTVQWHIFFCLAMRTTMVSYGATTPYGVNITLPKRNACNI